MVLHYANCGFAAWRAKYATLARGHGTADGGFLKEARSLPGHLASATVLNGASAGTGASRDGGVGDADSREGHGVAPPAWEARAYYDTFIACDSGGGELSHLAQHGLLTRVAAVRDTLAALEETGDLCVGGAERERADLKAAGALRGPTLPIDVAVPGFFMESLPGFMCP